MYAETREMAIQRMRQGWTDEEIATSLPLSLRDVAIIRGNLPPKSKVTKCKHKWVDMEDGTIDKFCVRCRKFAMQAVMKSASASATVNASSPMVRETIEVPFYTGSEHVRINVYKDDLLKQMNKEIGLLPDLFSSASR